MACTDIVLTLPLLNVKPEVGEISMFYSNHLYYQLRTSPIAMRTQCGGNYSNCGTSLVSSFKFIDLQSPLHMYYMVAKKN